MVIERKHYTIYIDLEPFDLKILNQL